MRWEHSYGLDIDRMTRNPNQGFYYFIIIIHLGGVEQGG